MKKTNTTETYHCDRCSKEIPARYSGDGYHWELVEYEHYEHPHNGDANIGSRTKIDLCNDCGRLAEHFLKSKTTHEFDANGMKILVMPKQGSLY